MLFLQLLPGGATSTFDALGFIWKTWDSQPVAVLGYSKEQWQVLFMAEDTKPGDISAFYARQGSSRVLCYDNGIMNDVNRLTRKKRCQFFALILILTQKCSCSMPGAMVGLNIFEKR